MLAALDPAHYRPLETAGTLRALGPWWAQVLDGRETDAAEAALRRTVELLVGLPTTPEAPGTRLGVAELIRWLEPAGRAAARSASGDAPEAAAGVAAGAVAELLDVTAALRGAAADRPAPTGVVAALHRGDGGVPKTAVERVEIGPRGVVGDRQASAVHHGRAWQALCIWSTEVIDDLAAQGHPIGAGAAGENITVTGLPWADVRPGARLRLGDAAAEVAPYALPCAQNRRWFADGDVDHMHHRRGPVSRVYALVVETGPVAVGDAVTLEPI